MSTEITTHARFDEIRYAQCWEDADVLLAAAGDRARGTCLSVASAGDNTLALVGAGARRVIAVDLSDAQLACLDLRVAAFRTLTHSEMLQLLGAAPGDRRAELYRRCRASLSARGRAYWDDRGALIARGLAHSGRFERYLEVFRRRLLPLVHGQARIARLFELGSETERRWYYDEHWNNRRWRLLCRAAFARRTLGRYGRDPGFTRYADEPVWQSLARRIPQALVVQRPADNPYLQWILTGGYRSALPFAMRPENFDRIRDNLAALEWHRGSVEDTAVTLPVGSVDLFNLSDIFEYMGAPAYHRALGALASAAAPGARLVYWNVVTPRRRPERMAARLRSLRRLSASLHAADKAFFYRDLVIEEALS